MIVLNNLSKVKLCSNSQLAVYSKLNKTMYYCNLPRSADKSIIYSTDNTIQINIPLLNADDEIQIIGYLSSLYSTDNSIFIGLTDSETKEFISKYNFPINLKRYNCIRMGSIYFDEVLNEWVFNVNSVYKKVNLITQIEGVL